MKHSEFEAKTFEGAFKKCFNCRFVYDWKSIRALMKNDAIYNKSFKQNKEWQDQGLPKIKIAINVAHLQLQHDGFIDSVKSALAKSKLEPQYLGIDLSENIFIDNYEKTVYYNNLIEKMLSTGTSISVVNIIKKELLENK